MKDHHSIYYDLLYKQFLTDNLEFFLFFFLLAFFLICYQTIKKIVRMIDTMKKKMNHDLNTIFELKRDEIES